MKKQPYLASPAQTAAVLRHHHISARKKYGQNFLIDPGVLEDTIRAADLSEDDFVLEVGPGIGTLTQYLCFAAGRVCAVEIDRSLLPVLEDTLQGWNNVTVRNEDILKTDLAALAESENGGKPMKAVANLPYYITTPVIMNLLTESSAVDSVTVMVQKEVADRMQAEPGTKSYGALTLSVQYYAEPEIVRIVRPSSFIPQPGVDSAVIHLKRRRVPPVSVKNEKLLFALIRASFNQRRKKLTNGITNFEGFRFSKQEAEEAVVSCGLDPGVRGETLPLFAFAALADALDGRRA